MRYNGRVLVSRGLTALLRFAFQQLYTHFAFAYDGVSAIVSRGEWRAWTRAALPFVRGKRVLEIAFGTGDLQLDLYDAGYAPVGVDLSPYMHAIARRKFRAQRSSAARIQPRLVRAHVRRLPFPDAYFSTLIMTFPPGFIHDAEAMTEMRRVLEAQGVLIWVDAPYLYPRDTWGRFLNFLFRLTGGCADPDVEKLLRDVRAVEEEAHLTGWKWRVETVECANSRVHVFIGERGEFTMNLCSPAF